MADEDAWDADRDPDPVDPGRHTDPPRGITLRWQNGVVREITPEYVRLDDDGHPMWWAQVTAEEMTGLQLQLCAFVVEHLGAATLHVSPVAP